MGGESGPGRCRLEPEHPFRALYVQAGRRWLIFLAALAALIWLGYFAGMVRNPGGVKRPWAVVASRAMAAVGGVIVLRLLLFSYEERVPVFYVKANKVSREALAGWIQSLRGREERVVPLSDVMAFMSERRYVPKGAIGLVLEAGAVEEIESLASIAGDLRVTILLPVEAFDKLRKDGVQAASGPAGRAAVKQLPDSVAIGAVLGAGQVPVNEGEPALKNARTALNRFAEGARLHLRRSPICAAPGEECVALSGGDSAIDPGTPAGAGGYTCCLGGGGYNRFGDRPYLIRPLDITPVIRLGRLRGLNTMVYAGMFRGGHIWWPVAAILRVVGASPGWR